MRSTSQMRPDEDGGPYAASLDTRRKPAKPHLHSQPEDDRQYVGNRGKRFLHDPPPATSMANYMNWAEATGTNTPATGHALKNGPGPRTTGNVSASVRIGTRNSSSMAAHSLRRPILECTRVQRKPELRHYHQRRVARPPTRAW